MPIGILHSLVLTLVLIAAIPAHADFGSGQRALEAGELDEALSQWLRAADEGDGRAMLALGRLHREGRGILQDYVEAHRWFNLAASKGVADAAKERDALSAQMTPAQIAAAQERAAAWRPVDTPSDVTATRPQVPAREAGPPPREAIEQAQSLLTKLGYAPGPADGLWGSRTGAAYKAFLRDAGLPITDTLTLSALLAMRDIVDSRGSGVASGTESSSGQAFPEEALHRAVQAGDRGSLEAALVAGADVNGLDGRGWTALMHAANEGHAELAWRLLNATAKTDMRAPDGATALFIAALQGHAEIVSLLVEAKADASIPGPEGMTAADVASRRGDSSVLRAMVSAQAVDTFRDCQTCPEMVVVPADSFTMGSPSSEEGRSEDEGPQRIVTISRPIAVGKFEVTRGEFERFVAATGYMTGDSCTTYGEDGEWKERSGRSWRNAGFPQTDRDPVTCVNWDDAQSYARWLSRETGETYRLLTESEWEYAARAGTRSSRYWGDSLSGQCSFANGADGKWKEIHPGWTTAPCDDGFAYTAPAGSFGANGFGLHDMAGNVSEWVEDCWHGNYGAAPSDGSAWVSDGDCGRRVLRGSSWIHSPGNLRSANRGGSDAGGRDHVVGFRIARSLSP